MRRIRSRLFPIASLIVGATALGFLKISCVPKNPLTVPQVEEMVRRSAPIGSTRAQAEAWMTSRNIEHSYSDEPAAFSEIAHNVSNVGRYKGLIVALIRDTDRSLFVEGSIQIFLLLDDDGKVARPLIVWGGTGP